MKEGYECMELQVFVAAVLYSQMIIPSHSADGDVTAMLMYLGSPVCTQSLLKL